MLKGRSLELVQAMEKTLDLLYLLTRSRDKISIAEMAEKLSLNRRDVRHLLIMLETREMVRWDETMRSYRPGRKALDCSRDFTTPQPVTKPAGGRATLPLKQVQRSSAGRQLASGAMA